MDIFFYFIFFTFILYILLKGFFKKVFKEAFIELLNKDNEKLKLFIKECLREHDFSKRNKN
ncbi:hypothetical protein ACSXC4_15805 (plasmid) [Clostridium perfringens]|uniref:Uncharacterized protein n=1 Tax=Clostridium perfringens TaxID=1502 RepID=A0A127EE67_CLOPF|nr:MULTISPECIES: hypothetical protein [Clostridium]AMN34243.1 hypothetical protein JFP838_00120 [Clostridium perfringens]MDK7591128.1 hypothetical protein [Clostridium sp. UMB9555B]MDK7629412.1 hypothetical protein [Clostridium sp. UMB9555A]